MAAIFQWRLLPSESHTVTIDGGIHVFPLVLAMAEEDSDTEYIHAVYMQYSSLMLAIARRFVQTKYDQEEVISDAIVALIKNSATLRTLQGGRRRKEFE